LLARRPEIDFDFRACDAQTSVSQRLA